MADYQNHLKWGAISAIACSFTASLLGFAAPQYIPLLVGTAVIASLAPDVDSNSSRPLALIFQGAAILIPPILIWRIRWLHANPERAIFVWLLSAGLVLYPIKWLFKRFTIHRGIFHSVPAAVLLGVICFFLARNEGMGRKLQIAFGFVAFTGYITHLLLDELWAVDFNGKKVKKKKSFGTAFKFISPGLWNNIALYVITILMCRAAWAQWHRIPFMPYFEMNQLIKWVNEVIIN